MPISKYFGGKGEKVMKAMKKTYGKRKAESVFYATAAKRGAHGSGKFNAKETQRGYKVMANADDLYEMCEDMADMRGTMSPDNRVHPQTRHSHSKMERKERY